MLDMARHAGPVPRKPRRVHTPTEQELSYRVALGQRIRHLRSPEYSQEEFADAIDVFRSHMSTIERGKTDLKLSTISRIAKALEMSLTDLLDFDVKSDV
jgi:DNA-binding XRE family transcriptional regulator